MTRASRWRTAAPDLPPEFVHRPALADVLDSGEDCALTLVSAPPGYGKTLALAEWVHRQEETCAWVALEEEDDAPERLWGSVLTALGACPAVPTASRLRSLVVPRGPVGVDFLSDLLEALAAVPARIRLVLDDAHHLRSPQTLHGLNLFLRQPPHNVRLVLASRFDPVLPVARLRLEERLCELRTDRLRFSAEETAALAGLCGLRLTDEQVAALHARADGWAAGIRLAVLALRGRPEPDRFLAAFSGDDRPVADYLADEVMTHLSAANVELLRRTSISDPIPTPLAVELSGQADAGDRLSALERTTGLVVASGPQRTEYRVQQLMRSYLSADLQRHGPALPAQLHRKAARWWAGQSRPVEALHHAAQAGDSSLVTAFLHRWAPELVTRGEHAELRRALAAAGNAGADAWLPLVSAQIHLGSGDLPGARSDVRRARALETGPDDDLLAQFRAATSALAGMPGPVPDEVTEPDDPALAALAAAARGVAQIFPAQADRPVGAEAVPRDLETALAVARDQRLGLLEVQSLCLIGTAAASAADHPRAAAAAAAAITAAAAQGWRDSPWTAIAHAVLAHSCLGRASPGRALQVAVDGLRICPADLDPVIRFALHVARGGALFDLGERTSGLLELQEAHAELGGRPVPAPLAASASLLEHRAALLLGSTAAAATSLSRLGSRGCADGELTLMHAWAEAATGSSNQARATVVPLLDGSLQPSLRSTLVEAWLVEAWAALRSGDRPGARQALQTALGHAEPLDALRPFALAGQGLRVLLVDQLNGATDASAFAFRCLCARQRVRQPPAPLLSTREQDVLTQLLSLSNLGEIAEDLAVSVNTIKSHVRSIYGKLGVSTRRTAVLTALDRGLLG